MRKRIVAFVAALVFVVAAPATALAAPGQDIKDACGVNFGYLVSAGKSSGEAAHQNYKGGANAFSDPAILAAHGYTP